MTNHSTDPRWKPEAGGLPERWGPHNGPLGLRSDTCASGAPGIAGTTEPAYAAAMLRQAREAALEGTIIPPPAPIEPPSEPHPADHRLVGIERACATLQRQALTIAEWAQYIAHQARKARAGK